jgi:hypothetical protein
MDCGMLPIITLIILCESFPERPHPGPNDWIIRRVIVGSSPKDVHPDYPLLESIFIPLDSLVDDISQQILQLETVFEAGAPQDRGQHFFDAFGGVFSFSLRLFANGVDFVNGKQRSTSNLSRFEFVNGKGR